MVEAVRDFAVTGALEAVKALEALILPACAFLLLGLLVKGRSLFADMRRAAAQGVLNVNLMLFNVVFVVPGLAVVSLWMHQLVATYDLALLDRAVWDGVHPVIVVLVAVFVGDFVAYWRHRLEHTPILWPSHAVHHSDDEMTWLTLQRFHPLNRLTTFAIDMSAPLLLGLPPFAIIANALVRHYYGYVIHADLPWTYGKASWLFVSPAMHRWHHAADERFFQTNFATVFSVFDRAFGTYRVPGPCTAPLGVTDDMRATLAGQLTYMFQPRAYKHLRNGTASPFRWNARRGEGATGEAASGIPGE